DWSSDVCSSDLSENLVGLDLLDVLLGDEGLVTGLLNGLLGGELPGADLLNSGLLDSLLGEDGLVTNLINGVLGNDLLGGDLVGADLLARSEEHTSELQSREKLVCRLLLEKKETLLFVY